MKQIQAELVQEYQCSGCVYGPYPSCFAKGKFLECSNHKPGTIVNSPINTIFLGMPKGFNKAFLHNKVFYCKDSMDLDFLNKAVCKQKMPDGRFAIFVVSPRVNDVRFYILDNLPSKLADLPDNIANINFAGDNSVYQSISVKIVEKYNDRMISGQYLLWQRVENDVTFLRCISKDFSELTVFIFHEKLHFDCYTLTDNDVSRID